MVLQMQDYFSGSRGSLLQKRIDKVPIPTAKTQVLPQERETYPNIILTFGQFVGERVSLEVVLRYGSCMSVKMSRFA